GLDAPSLAQAQKFLAARGPGAGVMVKAVKGGGGRGMRVARSAHELAAAFERCASEAHAAFGDGALYIELFLENARHIEVQIVGDGDSAIHLWDRDCSLQRQRQKIIEIAPAAGLAHDLREALFAAALELAHATRYRGLGTFEFLVNA